MGDIITDDDFEAKVEAQMARDSKAPLQVYLLTAQHGEEDNPNQWVILAHVDFQAIALAKAKLHEWYDELGFDVGDVTWQLHRPAMDGEPRVLNWHTDDMPKVRDK